jgi:trypsin
MRRAAIVLAAAALAVAAFPGVGQEPASASYLGTRLPLSAAPWMASLTPLDEHHKPAKTVPGHALRCSAAVIGPRLVVIADHCVENYDMGHQGIHVGSDDLLRPGGRVVPIARVWSLRVHSRTLLHPTGEDTALVETTKPLGVPALPVASEPPKPGETVSSFGFGDDRPQLDVASDPRPFLRRIDLTVLGACPLVITDTTAICTRAPNGGGPRPGDSGGPLVVWRAGSPQLVGDASQGFGDAAGSVNLFADVVRQRTFIAAPPKRTQVPVVARPIRVAGDVRAGGRASCGVTFTTRPTEVEYRWNVGGHGHTGVYYDIHGERRTYFDRLDPQGSAPAFRIPRNAAGKRLQCVVVANAGPFFQTIAVAVVARVRR